MSQHANLLNKIGKLQFENSERVFHHRNAIRLSFTKSENNYFLASSCWEVHSSRAKVQSCTSSLRPHMGPKYASLWPQTILPFATTPTSDSIWARTWGSASWGSMAKNPFTRHVPSFVGSSLRSPAYPTYHTLIWKYRAATATCFKHNLTYQYMNAKTKHAHHNGEDKRWRSI